MKDYSHNQGEERDQLNKSQGTVSRVGVLIRWHRVTWVDGATHGG